MSDEDNLSSNDVCITEDAFEMFQAGALVEEEEFITLDDIVSPQPEIPDLGNELNEIPYDNEVVLASNNGDTPGLDGNVASNFHSIDDIENEATENNTRGLGITNHTNAGNKRNLSNKTQKRGRGRRKTKSVQNPDSYQNDSSHFETENDSLINNYTSQGNVHSTTVDKNGTELCNNSQEEPKYPRRTRRERIPNTSKYPLLSEITSDPMASNSTPKRRRGRPKKVPQETTLISEPDSTNNDTSIVNEDSNITDSSLVDSSKQPTSKRGRKRNPRTSQAVTEQVSPNALLDENKGDDNDLPHSELKKTRRGRKKVNDTVDKSVEGTVQDIEITNTQSNEQSSENINTHLENDLSDLIASSTKDIMNSDHEQEDMDIEDDICLSKIKEDIKNITENFDDDIEANMLRIHGGNTGNESTVNGDIQLPAIADFEETIDKMGQASTIESSSFQNNSNDLLVEDTSKRPNRRKAKKNFKYDEDSDEDPFANVELSDDEPSSHRKKTKYNDDDEYVPGGRKGAAVTTSSDSEINEGIEEGKTQKKRKVFSQSPKKRGRKSKIELSSKSDLNTEEVVEPLNQLAKPLSVDEDSDEPLSMKPPAEAWATSNAFENFIAQKIQGSNLKIKKVSTKQKSESVVPPLDIPVLKPELPKKFIEISCQTFNPATNSTAVQTSVPYDIPMKIKIPLTSTQTEKACEFLNSVVKTTAELGQLMKDKSQDFMAKKINASNVTDTFKMDYCVRKSFLLFKLAKHNLMQMEEDLAKQYDEFLKINNIAHCRDQIKDIAPTKKTEAKADSDSDCEIVNVEEGPSTSSTVKQDKPKTIIPKTVFLNKELSIKMAKKSSDQKEESDVRQNYTVWINDAVMVKKVKPTQSFLAQDSRNKKPPDYVTEKMLSDFFENYYSQKAMEVCAPFVATEWLPSREHRAYACYYFVKCDEFDDQCISTGEMIDQNELQINENTTDGNGGEIIGLQKIHMNTPKSLSSLCTEVVCNCLHLHINGEVNEELIYNITDTKVVNTPLSLFRLCYQSLPDKHITKVSNDSLVSDNLMDKHLVLNVPPLKTLCYKRVAQLVFNENQNLNLQDLDESFHDSDILSDCNSLNEDILLHNNDDKASLNGSVINESHVTKKNVKSLLALCIASIQGTMYPKINSVYSLKCIAYNTVRHMMYGDDVIDVVKEHNIASIVCYTNSTPDQQEDFAENVINTIKSEILCNDADNELPDEENYEDYGDDNNSDFDANSEGQDMTDNQSNENEWISQVQMQVLSSCIPPADSPTGGDTEHHDIAPSLGFTETGHEGTNAENESHLESTSYPSLASITDGALNNVAIVPNIKQELLDDIIENIVDSSIIKTEPVHGLDGMTIIPESIMTKREYMEQNTEHDDDAGIEADKTGASASYDGNSFEQFVRTNKMMRSMDDQEEDSDDDLFSRRGVKRSEHVPDIDAGNDMNESLLVPHTFEPLPVDSVKGVLMESSSDESSSLTTKQGKKKPEKRKGRPKKLPKEVPKVNITKEVPVSTKESPSPVKDKIPTNEVAILTRRMREKIRQEEKKIESSDSESDNVALSLRKDRNKAKQPEPPQSNKKSKKGESSRSKEIDDEIQCNNVDSTENTLGCKEKEQSIIDQFTGFSAIDQNEISSYQKFMKFVYDKIVPGENNAAAQADAGTDKKNDDSSRPVSPLISAEEPVELLECEPTIPMFDDDNELSTGKRAKRVSKKKETKEKDQPKDTPTKDNVSKEGITTDKSHASASKFTEHDGWHIYPVDSSDMKLYQNCQIPLEKLPESFVDTYLEYHDITDRDNIDKEIDRLANLNTLNRATGIKEGKGKSRLKSKSSNASEQNSANVSRAPSPAGSDRLDELTPSEDEGANLDDEEPPPVPVRSTENNLAKNLLMDDHDSDSDGGTKKKVKQEPNDNTEVATENQRPRKPGPKSKTITAKANKDNLPPSDPIMLTADKMMNMELNLLHCPVVMTKSEPKEVTVKEPSPKDESKPNKKKSSRISAMKDRPKAEDDSSSEEEKQWVSTKEKLLKRIGRKEDAIAEDAKRAKLVDEFIDRRGQGHESRRSLQPRSRRSRKKILERMRQQRFLSKELFGESSIEAAPGSKRGAAGGLFKGRRNIRKVLDKKSLQKSTVIANMEEFDRKRRLNAKQNQLRELLGYEEGVSVLVINDEVCLEYDFEEQRPIVTVHPFFTKVMKAHQYEGVKFMWDACFESLAGIEAGRGGGCILAHCMGLGKTLQVLALLHTVLTHPRANMHRVLVCCPLSTVLNWVDEIHKWIGPVTDQIKVFELSKLKKIYERAYQLEDWYNGGGIFIIGYELFRSLTTLDPQIDDIRPTIVNKIRTALLDPGPDIIICDEGHLLKNDCSVLAVAMSRVVTKRRIVLTGTPMQNNLREYFCMVNFVKPNLLGTYSEYSNRFENPIMNGQHRDSSEEDIKLMKARTHILHKVLEGCLQRQEASVLYPYLPKKHEYTVFIPLTKCQWDIYKHYVHNYTKKTSKNNVLRDFHILQKIWSHPLVLHNFHAKKREIKPDKLEDDLALEDKEDIKPPEMDTWWLQYLADGEMLNSINSSNKFVAVFRILDECIALGDKVLIFSTSLHCLDALECFLRQINGWNLGQEYYRLDGSVPAEVRQKWVREYNAENNHKTKLFLISTRAGCLGLNMTAANRVIILDTSWNPAHDIQSIFRVYRFGQKKDCFIYRLVAMGTMEQKIYERSVTKQAVACRVVDEQQIDRHYNMAELTELYKFDEYGLGVAGGVAVGVADVALLRVARDAAIHAVHEHDSLLRGSGEQELPEYERAAAWMQFQQEHAHKQMQNDMETDKAARALKKLQDKQLKEKLERESLEQQQLLEKQQSQVLNIKTEDGPMHNLLVPKAIQPSVRGRGGARGRLRSRVVQCRIPIKINPEPAQPGPSKPISEEEMVQQISDILIKYNFTKTGKGPQQIKELVAKVKTMVQTGQAIELGEYDELTASIVKVLMQKKGQAPEPAPEPAPVPAPVMPALTDIEYHPPRRGRPRKESHGVRKDFDSVPVPTAVARPVEDNGVGVSGRLRRRAAIQAERQFDLNDDGASQDSAPADVIELDDDDWHAASDTDSAPETNSDNQRNKPQKTDKQESDNVKSLVDELTKTKWKTVASKNAIKAPAPAEDSIVLSDDEPSPPPAVPTPPPAKPITPLHPSLLTNKNFIKIVAHTYLAGNPMLDEDAATLAAQYSTLKLLEEFENTRKPIDSGPIYDIAIKVLGESVLIKLQQQPSNVKQEDKGTGASNESSAASSKMMQFLGENKLAEPAPGPPKKKVGPKSRVKAVKEEVQEVPKVVTPPAAKQRLGLVPVDRLRKCTPAPAPEPRPAPAPEPRPAPPAQAAGESILPDDEDDVRCITNPTPTTKPLVKIKLVKKEPGGQPTSTIVRVTSAAKPAPQKPAPSTPATETYMTISLDSDDEEPAAAPPPRTRGQAARGPVPVALTGPDSRTIPLTPPAPKPTPPLGQANFYPYQSTITRPPEPVPVSFTGPGTGPVPISLTGPDNLPVPISLMGPGFQSIPLSMGQARSTASYVGHDAPPMSYAAPQQQTMGSFANTPGGVPMSFASTSNSMPMKFSVATSSGVLRPVAMPLPAGAPVPAGLRAVRLALPPGQTPADLQHMPPGSTVYLSAVGAQTPTNTMPAPAPAPAPAPQVTKTLCKPGDILRLTATGQLEVIKRVDDPNEVHTIDDGYDDPTPVVAAPPMPVITMNTRVRNNMQSLAPAPTVSQQTPQKLSPATKAPKPVAAPKSATPKPDAPAPPKSATPKPAAPAPPKQKNDEADRRKRRRIISSSDSSRSPSPDVLSIFKDVVHIQAPERKPKAKASTPAPTPPEPRSTTTSAQKPTQQKPASSQRKENAITQKINNVLNSVKAKKGSVISANKAAANWSSTTKGTRESISIDLTDVKLASSKDAAKSSKSSKPTSSGKKDVPTTVVGTSKNIVLDGKSKSLTNKDMVDLTGQKNVQVTRVKTWYPLEKRAAPPPDPPVAKKKKTEPMTLKDFDIDDIDDIIELE